MGRPKRYTPKALDRAVENYFRSITRKKALTEQVPTGRRDEKGHMIYEPAPVFNDLGEKVIITEYVLPPSVTDLCQALGIHRSTWVNYCDAEQHPEYAETVERVQARMEAWNERELLTRGGKDIKGIIFNLQQNYGWGGEKHEMELSGGALEAFLREAGEAGE